MNHRIIDCTIHKLTGPQVLEQVLRLFRQSKSDPVVIETERGQGEAMIQKIRTELSRTRRRYQKEGIAVSQFGFKDEPMGVPTIPGVVQHEYHMIQFHVTPLQQMKNMADRLSDLEMQL